MAELLALAAYRVLVPVAEMRARRDLRRRLAHAVTILVDALDVLDGDPDLEEDEGDHLDLGEHDEAELSGIGDMDGLCEQVPAWDGYLPWSNRGYVA